MSAHHETNTRIDITGSFPQSGKMCICSFRFGSKNSCWIKFVLDNEECLSSAPSLAARASPRYTASLVKSTHPLVRVLVKNLLSNDWADVTGHVCRFECANRTRRLCFAPNAPAALHLHCRKLPPDSGIFRSSSQAERKECTREMPATEESFPHPPEKDFLIRGAPRITVPRRHFPDSPGGRGACPS